MAVWQKGSKESLLAADESCDSLRVNSIRPNYCGRDPSPQYSLLRTVMSVLWRCSCEIDRIDTVLGANREVINRSNLKSNCEGAPRSWGPTDLLTEKTKHTIKTGVWPVIGPQNQACHPSWAPTSDIPTFQVQGTLRGHITFPLLPGKERVAKLMLCLAWQGHTTCIQLQLLESEGCHGLRMPDSS